LRSGTPVPYQFTICDFRDDSSYEDILGKYFPAKKVWIIGARGNKTGRISKPVLRKDVAEIVERMRQEDQSLSFYIEDYIENMTE
jgi:hypothetical protein